MVSSRVLHVHPPTAQLPNSMGVMDMSVVPGCFVYMSVPYLAQGCDVVLTVEADTNARSIIMLR